MALEKSGQEAQPEVPQNRLVIPLYKSVDPWAPSIHQSIIYRRSRGDTEGIDDIILPDPRHNPLFRSFHLFNRRTSFSLTPQALHQSLHPSPRRLSVSDQSDTRPSLPPPSPHHLLPPPRHEHEHSSSPSAAPQAILWSGEEVPAPAPPLSPVNSISGFNFRLETEVEPSEQSHISSTRPLCPKGNDPSSPTLPESDTTEDTPFEARDLILAFITDTLPRQIYLHCLLRMPSLYFSRVDRIFIDADLTIGEIKDMALRSTAGDSKSFDIYLMNLGYDQYIDSPNDLLPPAYRRMKIGWEGFVDNLMKEWKTQNILSAMLLTGVFTMLQLNGMTSDPVKRYLGLWCLLCSFLSLLYGCTYIMRFAPMRKAYQAAEWTMEARRSQTIFWNVWVMLALPLTWLGWAGISFVVCLMSFVWKPTISGTDDPPPSIPESAELCFRLFICAVFCTGFLYLILISITFRRYGPNIDRAWKQRVESFIARGIAVPVHIRRPPNVQEPLSPRSLPRTSPNPLPSPLEPASEPRSLIIQTEVGSTPESSRNPHPVSSPISSPSEQRRSAWRQVASPRVRPLRRESSDSWIGLASHPLSPKSAVDSPSEELPSRLPEDFPPQSNRIPPLPPSPWPDTPNPPSPSRCYPIEAESQEHVNGVLTGAVMFTPTTGLEHRSPISVRSREAKSIANQVQPSCTRAMHLSNSPTATQKGSVTVVEDASGDKENILLAAIRSRPAWTRNCGVDEFNNLDSTGQRPCAPTTQEPGVHHSTQIEGNDLIELREDPWLSGTFRVIDKFFDATENTHEKWV